MDDVEKNDIESMGESGKEILNQLSNALRDKNKDLLRVTIDSLQDIIDPKKMCSRMRDYDLQKLIDGESTCLYVGTGSTGSRIFIGSLFEEHKRLYMPFSEEDEKRGYGNDDRANFKKLFNIPEGQELSVDF